MWRAHQAFQVTNCGGDPDVEIWAKKYRCQDLGARLQRIRQDRRAAFTGAMPIIGRSGRILPLEAAGPWAQEVLHRRLPRQIGRCFHRLYLPDRGHWAWRLGQFQYPQRPLAPDTAKSHALREKGPGTGKEVEISAYAVAVADSDAIWVVGVQLDPVQRNTRLAVTLEPDGFVQASSTPVDTVAVAEVRRWWRTTSSGLGGVQRRHSDTYIRAVSAGIVKRTCGGQAVVAVQGVHKAHIADSWQKEVPGRVRRGICADNRVGQEHRAWEPVIQCADARRRTGAAESG